MIKIKHTLHLSTLIILAFLMLGLTACQDFTSATDPMNNPGGSNPDPIPTEPLIVDLGFCDALSEGPDGRLCAIQPSKTDANIRDFALSTQAVPGPGFGYHVIGVPTDWNSIKGVWFHFSGSYGSPYQPGGQNAGDFVSRVWMNEIVKEGYLVVGIAYNNPFAINNEICGPTSAGIDVDNCAGDARLEILEGIDHSTEVDVNLSNGVYNRLDKLLAYLAAEGLNLPKYFRSGSVDWSQINVSGHSQGAGHAYYMAKNVGVRFACFLGGPYDGVDTVNPGPTPIADWYTVPGSLTSAANMGSFLVTTDDNYNAFVGTYDLIGLTKNTHWFEAAGDYVNDEGDAVNGHAASLVAPALASLRAQACF